jgi:hypothetical protein
MAVRIEDGGADRPVAGAARSSIKVALVERPEPTMGEVRLDDQVPAPQGFSPAQGSRRGRTLLPTRSKDGQNRVITSGIWGMSVKGEARMPYLPGNRTDCLPRS